MKHKLIFKNKWSAFKNKKLVIKDSATPIPWDNYLFSRDGKFYAEISQKGIGPVYYNYEASFVSKGRNYCLKDSTGDVWSLNGGDSLCEPESYICEQEPGRSVYVVNNHGITSRIIVAIDPDNYVEVNQLILENMTEYPQKIFLTACNYIELEGVDNTQQLEQTEFDAKTGALLCQRRSGMSPNNKYAAFYVADLKPDSFCGSYEDFLGSDCSITKAIVWRKNKLPGTNAYSTKPIMNLRYKVILQPKSKKIINFGFGIANDFSDALDKAKFFLKSKQAITALSNNKIYYSSIIDTGMVETPEENINLMLNTWSKIQLYHQNISARKGQLHNWRNNLQDAMGWLIFNPTIAADRIKGICSLAQKDGFMPRSSPKGDMVFDKNIHQLNQKHTDIATWAALCAARYANETGNLKLFQKKIFYANGEKQATIAQCLCNGLQWMLDHRGKHGMVLFLDGDWSDPLEAAGKKGIGESPWNSVALINAIKEFSPVLRYLNMISTAEKLEKSAIELTNSVNKYAWDGKWYIRGITDDGIRFCTQNDPDANVSLMMQVWSIISKVIPHGRLDSVVAALEKSCQTNMGPILYGPPFMRERPEIGRESAKRPGTGENGSCYTHAAMMLAWAELINNRPNKALQVIKQVIPLATDDIYSIRKSSPLWWANYYQGPHAEFPGRSSNIIASGAPAWFFMNIYQGFLGINPTIEGLLIKPCFPDDWPNAKVTRIWRGSIYDFEFIRQSNNSANCQIFVDNQELSSSVILPDCNKQRHVVKIIFP